MRRVSAWYNLTPCGIFCRQRRWVQSGSMTFLLGFALPFLAAFLVPEHSMLHPNKQQRHYKLGLFCMYSSYIGCASNIWGYLCSKHLESRCEILKDSYPYPPSPLLDQNIYIFNFKSFGAVIVFFCIWKSRNVTLFNITFRHLSK